MRAPLWQPRSDPSARLLGAGFFVLGLGLLALQAQSIRHALAAHAPVTYFTAAIALGEFATAVGAYWMLRGLAGYHSVRSVRKNPAALRWLGCAAAIVIGGTLLGLHCWLAARGYDF